VDATRTSPPDHEGRAAERPSTDLAGTVIAARYKLLQEIGEGGMGTVWMAEQTHPIKRLVAVKLIKPGMDSKTVLARFGAERQALAMMDHPNIARVVDGGTTEAGRPYFVMELVKGLPITQYCDDRSLPIRDRLELIQMVCGAVQHAHQKGIIHRDLKPTNVLVTEHDGRPIPKVIDFGLAKALYNPQALTDQTLFTAFGAAVGTPLYMAPEQFGVNALDVDTRTDIYSLGVILYELLTGSTPLEKRRLREAAWDEVRRLIQEEEPPRPSLRLSSCDALPSIAARRQTDPVRLGKLVRGELDWIVMKALEKDRNRRFGTASALADDLRRLLSNEPVSAGPPTVQYKLRKFARRNRGPLVAVALVLLVLLGGVVGTTIGLIEARRQRDEAELARRHEVEQRAEADRQRDEAKRNRVRADQGFQLARGAVDSYLAKIGSSPRLEQAGLQTLRKELLQEAGTFYEQLTRLEADDPGLKADLAAALRNYAMVARWNGSSRQAIERLERAMALYEQIVAVDPGNDEHQAALAATAEALGDLHAEQSSIAKAEENFQKAIAIRERLSAARPRDEERQAELANAYWRYATSLMLTFPTETRV